RPRGHRARRVPVPVPDDGQPHHARALAHARRIGGAPDEADAGVAMKFLRMEDVDLRGKRIFIRSDLNVPVDDAGAIGDDTRIRASLPAYRLALEKGAALMATSHLGRPKEGEFSPADSLAPVARRIAELLGRDVPLARDWTGGVDVKPGAMVLLENCRFNK